ncbi:unnamed protein product [Rangifer tarandus platyrhynchus]|uniref:Uncharacterized protein n=2 Tax=Rangifer tarandus platyrhynchus TaxID=3082113 RepID=A0AC59ZD71_RANTA|nr:unnamed protein product [Rangifer tarandus platyrhynchus]
MPAPPALRAHQSPNPRLDLISSFEGPSPFLSLVRLFFTCIWLISLLEPGNKGTASSHPCWGVSVPRPEACTALLAIIFNARPSEPPESAGRARAHLLPPLAIYLHLAGERIDLLRARGAGLGRGCRPSSRCSSGPGLKCQCGQAGWGGHRRRL